MYANRSDPILYRHSNNKIFLIDIPGSIASAQGSVGSFRLLSCTPLALQYENTEPKSASARARITNHDHDVELHQQYAECVCAALDDIRSAQKSLKTELWCQRRIVVLENRPETRKRKISVSSSKPSELTETLRNPSPATGISALFEAVISNARTTTKCVTFDTFPRMHQVQQGCEQADDLASVNVWNGFFKNDCNKPLVLSLSDNAYDKHVVDPQFCQFRIPPRCSFLLGNCNSVGDFRAAVRNGCAATLKGRFDFILLDPPWPNRSVLRKGNYNTQSNLPAIKLMMLRMDLDTHVLPGGIIAIWITNKPACRELVLGHGGLFDAWNVGLFEEWIWLKITSFGEPITPIEGIWRKPYEVLLVGKAPKDAMALAQQAECVTRRVIVGVPDLHSRKPCLKQLIEELLLNHSEAYSALEVFARYLVTGWFAWGNEVLKYNWKGYWQVNDAEVTRGPGTCGRVPQ